jgi:hypothetical protein
MMIAVRPLAAVLCAAFCWTITCEAQKSRFVKPAGRSGWRYEQEKDEMRGTVSRYAVLRSSTVLNFGFPYGNASTIDLVIQNDPNGKITPIRLYLRVSEGQFSCRDDSDVAVKFDQGEIRNFHCLRASAGVTDAIFLEPSEDIIAGMKGSKKMIIEAPSIVLAVSR